MSTVLYWLECLTVISTGLLAGALVTEARVLVPYWQKMPIAEFLALHHTMASSLYRFFAPLTVAGTMLPIITVCVAIMQHNVALPWLISGVCAVALLLFYFLFFKGANHSFTVETDLDRSRATLTKWGTLHAKRTVIALVAFVAAMFGLLVER
ncbi:MAG: hypothetical protein AAGA84_12890 [Pseudomonadota bacterium]